MFNLKEEIKKFKESERRELFILGLFLEWKNPDLRNKEQLNWFVARHIRSAIRLTCFENDQLERAMEYADKEYDEIWTLETVEKILLK